MAVVLKAFGINRADEVRRDKNHFETTARTSRSGTKSKRERRDEWRKRNINGSETLDVGDGYENEQRTQKAVRQTHSKNVVKNIFDLFTFHGVPRPCVPLTMAVCVYVMQSKSNYVRRWARICSIQRIEIDWNRWCCCFAVSTIRHLSCSPSEEFWVLLCMWVNSLWRKEETEKSWSTLELETKLHELRFVRSTSLPHSHTLTLSLSTVPHSVQNKIINGVVDRLLS